MYYCIGKNKHYYCYDIHYVTYVYVVSIDCDGLYLFNLESPVSGWSSDVDWLSLIVFYRCLFGLSNNR